MEKRVKIQEQHSSNYDIRKFCSYDIEQLTEPTEPIMHSASRFWFFTSGKGSILIDDKLYQITKNTCIAISPWQVTEVIQVAEPLQFIRVIYNLDTIMQKMKIEYNLLNEEVNILGELQERTIIYCKEEECTTFLTIFSELQAELGVESILEASHIEKQLTNVYVMNKLMELIIWFIRFSSQNLQSETSEDQSHAIFKYIYANLNEKPTLDIIAQVFKMTEADVAQFCKNVTGYNFTDLVNQMRIMKASNLLLYTTLSLDEIVELISFTDAAHFCKMFFNRTGTTPHQYRSSYQEMSYAMNLEESTLQFDIITYIENNFDKDLSALEVAREFLIKPKELNRILLYTVEKNFTEFLKFLRIIQSTQLLLTTNKTILEIAVDCGYNNAKTFNNHFFQLRGETPSEFRDNIILDQKHL